jgi:hypothetical protein
MKINYFLDIKGYNKYMNRNQDKSLVLGLIILIFLGIVAYNIWDSLTCNRWEDTGEYTTDCTSSGSKGQFTNCITHKVKTCVERNK